MDHKTHLTPATVLLRPAVTTRDELVELMLAGLGECPGLTQQKATSRDAVLTALRERAPDTPFVEGGFACPHVRIEGFAGVALSVAILETPIVWREDTEPVDLVALLVGPAGDPSVCLQVLAQLARLAQLPDGRQTMLGHTSSSALCAWLRPRLFEAALVTARDIMRLPLGMIDQNIPLRELTVKMAALNLDAVGIQDEAGTLIGEITADRLFTKGMPEFFQQLKSVSFIAEFDPFEAYFKEVPNLLAKDVMTQGFAALPPDATLLEVVFELAVRKHPKVYVVDENNLLLGVIDRIRVLDRILNI